MMESADAAATARSAPSATEPIEQRASHSTPVVFAGALPPPVTGMTAMSAVIVDALRQRTHTTVVNWSTGKPLKGWRWRAARLWGVLKTLAALPLRGRGRGSVFYYSASSGVGMYYDLAVAALARALGYRLVLHHHVYSYLDRYDWRAAWLDRLVGSSGAHAVHCRLMQEHYQAQYCSLRTFLFVPPTIVSQQLERVEAPSHDDFVLGFLSNLTLAKGLGEVIATFERLARAGRRVRLVLAGPCMNSEARSIVDEALARWPEQVEFRGPVYGAEKARFFADLDAFLLPSRTESWGIVLSEALSVGCPVIANSRGCIPWIVQGGCGRVVQRNEDFVQVAAQQILAWIDSPDQYRSAQAAARERTEQLNDDARRELPAFVDQVIALGQK